jgi:pyruvate/2-oxoglutarate dehydrogenase complex dihydrolipoamide dehydrogenase (E3) component
MIIIGAGVVACELGQAFSRFGTSVKILMRGDELLKREDQDAQLLLETQLTKDGVKIHRKMEFQRVSYVDGVFTVVTKGIIEVLLLLCCCFCLFTTQ